MGGTNIRAARIADGQIEAMQAVSCNAQGTEQEVLDQIFQIVDAVFSPEVQCIGFGVPSVVDSSQGIVYDLQNIPSWKEVHLTDIFQARYGVKVVVNNDVNCFVLGEQCFGEARAFGNVVGITLGTGVGAGIVIGGHLYGGTNTGAGEIGCLPYLDSDYEHYCSSHFFKAHGTDGAVEAQRAAQGNAEAIALWREFGHHLGKLLQVILFAYDPEAIVIGGGIAASQALFEEAMMESMKQNFPYKVECDNVKVLFSKVENCNLLGASQLG